MQIAVIGAGISGLTIAYRLQQRGHSVTVFEKNLYPGGKCLTLPMSTGFCELGCVFGLSNSNSLIRLMKELNITKTMGYFYQNFFDNFGNIIPQIPQELLPELQSQYNRLPQELSPYYVYLTTPGMNAAPEELHIPFSRWCDSRGLSLLPLVFAPLFTGFGYGILDEIPAAYVLKNLDTTSLSSFGKPSKHITFVNGTTELCVRVASTLNDIRYNQEVSRISGSNPTRVLTQTGEYSFDAVVLTIPLPDCCESTPHSKLMQQYRHTSFSIFSYRSSVLPNTNIFFPSAFEADSGRRIMLLYSPSITGCGGIFNCYCHGDSNIALCKQDVEHELEQAGISTMGLFAYRQWENFPHVGSADLQNGFYETLANCQGNHGLYLGGGLASFSSFERLIEYSDYFVSEYF